MKVGLLWRQEWDAVVEGQPIRDTCRLRGVFAAFSALGIEPSLLCIPTRRLTRYAHRWSSSTACWSG